MNLNRIREYLKLPAGHDLDELYMAYMAEHGPDVVGFIAQLHAKGLVSHVQLRDSMVSMEVALSGKEALTSHPASRHRTVGLLGKGAMGEVHIARDETLQRTVAIKRIAPHLMQSSGSGLRFFNEVQITAQLDHPAIIPVYTLTSDDDQPSYTMKLVRGKTLDDVIEETKKFYDKKQKLPPTHDLAARLELFLQVCNAVDYAHSRGVIHRDLKPENIMVGPFHEVFVMDWGCARLIGGPETVNEEGLIVERPNVTRYGSSIGTPAYMSPEQAQGKNELLEGASDQYMLGLVLFEVVALKWAITGKTGSEVMARAADGEKEPFIHYKPSEPIPRELRGIFAKATAYAPGARYPTVGAMADDIRRFLRNEAVIAAPDNPFQMASRWVSHHREVTLGAVAALMLMLVMGVGVTLVGGTAALAAQQYRAQQREDRLTGVLGVVDTQAHRVDIEFQNYEALLAALASGAEQALANIPAGGQRVWLNGTYDLGNGPADLVPSQLYGQAISLEAIDHKVATGVDPKTVQYQLEQLNGLLPVLYGAIARSNPAIAAMNHQDQRTHILAGEAPLVWAYVATDQGVISSIPGGPGGYPDPYDPREQDWYKAGFGQHMPMWQPASLDESGMGLIVTCVTGVFAPDGHPTGVAAVDVAIDHIVHDLLSPPTDAPVTAWIVDSKGETIANSLSKRTSEAPPTFPYVDLLLATPNARTGHAVVGPPDHRELVVWSRLFALDWTYVVVGDEDAVLG
jgi:hypothetical protein